MLVNGATPTTTGYTKLQNCTEFQYNRHSVRTTIFSRQKAGHSYLTHYKLTYNNLSTKNTTFNRLRFKNRNNHGHLSAYFDFCRRKNR